MQQVILKIDICDEDCLTITLYTFGMYGRIPSFQGVLARHFMNQLRGK